MTDTEKVTKDQILEGRVKYCNSAGFGFIETKEKIDFYFHYTVFLDNWKVLLRRFVSREIIIVEFKNDLSATEGPKAKDVKFKALDKSISEA